MIDIDWNCKQSEDIAGKAEGKFTLIIAQLPCMFFPSPAPALLMHSETDQGIPAISSVPHILPAAHERQDDFVPTAMHAITLLSFVFDYHGICRIVVTFHGADFYQFLKFFDCSCLSKQSRYSLLYTHPA